MITTTEVRCAIYTRKSTDEGLDRDFNSLDAQRESGEAYIASRKEQNWRVLPAAYNDGGFTGGNMDRPAVHRLLDDIQAGKVDCVVVYKVDRLSRSLLDFARMLEVFERHDVSFVAVTQEFNTATPMGRLMLHVLLSFAQFERELISERTRDKMGAARRKGKWLGSVPSLGYDADREAARLIVNDEEAQRVNAIFRLYLECGSLLATVRELRRRGWHTKQTTTRQGRIRGGRAFNKASLRCLLTNVTYIGLVRYRGETYAGEQEAIVPEALFRRVEQLLRENRQPRHTRGKAHIRGVLQGRLYCTGCNTAMLHTYTSKGSRRYRYYVCSHANKHGYDQCQTRSLPAGEVERYVLSQIQDFLANGDQREATSADVAELIQRVEYDAQLGDLQIQFNSSWAQ